MPPESSSQSSVGMSLRRVGSVNLFLVLTLLPILYLAISDLDSFALGWNEGRAGLLFASVFLVFECFDGRRFFVYQARRWRVYSAFAVMVAALLYFTWILFFGLQSRVWDWGRSLGVRMLFSWIWIWDYLIFAAYLILLTLIFFNVKGLRHILASIIYLFGMVLILSLDALFPYDALGPLQAIVPVVLNINVFMLRILSLGSVTVWDNVVTLEGRHGPFTLAVYWPSAGIHSIIIYSLIMLAFLIKLNMRNRARLAYFAIGALGTFFINVIRIFLLSVYVLTVTTEVSKFEEFHAIAGEILFLPWIAIYLLLVSWFATHGPIKSLKLSAGRHQVQGSPS